MNATDVDGVTAFMHATFNFNKIYHEVLVKNAAGEEQAVFFDPKQNVLHWLPIDVKMSLKDGEIALMPTPINVLRYTESIDHFGIFPKWPKELSLLLISTVLLAIDGNYDKPCVDLLLKAGADVNVADIHGATAIGYAAYYGRVNIVNTLIKTGTDVNKSGENGITPLFLAAQAGHNKILEMLLYAGARVNAKTSNGFTPLMQAILAGHAQCADSLILAGADVNTAV